MKRDFWSRLEAHPPSLLRLLARVRWGRPLESTEIAQRSGLSVAHVEAISQSLTWDGIDLPSAKAFMRGCDCDLFNRGTYERIRWTVRQLRAVARKRPDATFPHLRKSGQWEAYYLPLVERFAKHLSRARN